MTYDFRFEKTPYDNLIQMIRWSKERNDAQSKERKQDWINLMKMMGKGVAAYKMNKDYNDWKADQAMWNDELGQLDDISTGYYDPEDVDIDAILEQERLLADSNDWRNQYSNSHRYGIDDNSLFAKYLA